MPNMTIIAPADGPELLGTVFWRPDRGEHLVTWLIPGYIVRQSRVSSLPLVGCAISALLLSRHVDVDAVLVEDQYMGVNPAGALKIARRRGQLEGGIIASVPAGRRIPVFRDASPPAWRKALGLPSKRGRVKLSREDLKAVSLAQIPPLLPGIAEVLATIGQWDDIAEAAGLALVGLQHRCWEGSADDFTLRIEAATGPISSMKGQRILRTRLKKEKGNG